MCQWVGILFLHWHLSLLHFPMLTVEIWPPACVHAAFPSSVCTTCRHLHVPVHSSHFSVQLCDSPACGQLLSVSFWSWRTSGENIWNPERMRHKLLAQRHRVNSRSCRQSILTQNYRDLEMWQTPPPMILEPSLNAVCTWYICAMAQWSTLLTFLYRQQLSALQYTKGPALKFKHNLPKPCTPYEAPLDESSSPSKVSFLTWWLSQKLGISGRPRSLNTLSFMLSTQGCSRTLEPNGGS